MSTRLKHRLLGLVVILLAVAILLPLLFRNSSSDQTKALVTQIPTPPQPSNIRFVEPSQNQAIAALASKPELSDSSQSQDSSSKAAESDGDLKNQVAVATQSPVAPPAVEKSTVAPVIKKAQKPSAKVVEARKKSVKQPASKKTVQASRPVDTGSVRTMKPMVQNVLKSEPSLMGLNTPRAWVIQLASFSEVSNADRLVNRLRGQGYNAYDRVTTSSSGQRIVRVFVGPDINVEEMNRTLKKLHTQFGLKGIVKRYQL